MEGSNWSHNNYVFTDSMVGPLRSMQQAFVLFGDVEPFMRENEHASSATRAKLLEFFDDPQKIIVPPQAGTCYHSRSRGTLREGYLCSGGQ